MSFKSQSQNPITWAIPTRQIGRQTQETSTNNNYKQQTQTTETEATCAYTGTIGTQEPNQVPERPNHNPLDKATMPALQTRL
jgi:hypothetical protein